jgi:D-alanine-D-alanine ligase-like ATP-grasp enzyme
MINRAPSQSENVSLYSSEIGTKPGQPLARVAFGAYGEFLIATTPIKAGQQVFFLNGRFQPVASKHSVQLDRGCHVVTETAIWRFTNHACVPNMRIDPATQSMVATCDIAEGEELNFNYNTSEWSISSPFSCGCGMAGCMGEVRGFRYVPEDRREELRPYLTPFLLQRWRDEHSASGVGKIAVRDLKPEVHVLIAYERENGELVSPEYDSEDFRKELAQWFEPIGLDWKWVPVSIDTVDAVVAGLSARQALHPIVVLNLCDGSEVDGYPGVSVINALAAAGLPFSGAGAEFYVKSTSKIAGKRSFDASGVPTPPMVVIEDVERDVDRAIAEVGLPFIVKPDVSGGSYGIQIDSVCHDRASAIAKIRQLQGDRYIGNCAIFVEAFVSGREFTVFAVEDETQPLGLRILTPCERAFDERLPEDERFIIYERHWDLPEEHRSLPPGEPYCVHKPVGGKLRDELEHVVRQAVRAVSGSSYARCDLRQDAKTGAISVLEVNAQCDLTENPASEIGSILRYSDMTMPELVEMILNHALSR